MIFKKYLHLDNNLHLHYRVCGAGLPVVLLHPSPRSSKIFEAFAKLLAPHFQAFMPDLFGYGLSDALPVPVNNLYDYLPYLKKAFEELGLQKFALYGSATGAQLAIAYANTYPDDVSALFLDNAAEFSDEQRNDIMQRYFIDPTPKIDGSHLQNIWQHIQKSIYAFPWYSEKEEDKLLKNKLPENVETVACNEVLIEYLLAGKNYADAYKAAFEHEKVENVLKTSVPTVLFRWQGSPVLKYIDQLLQHPLPQNIEIQEITSANRYEAMVETFKNKLI